MSTKNFLEFLKNKEAEFVDLRFTDPRGKLQHLTMDTSVVDEDMLNDGVFFDGYSIAGWKAINESDKILKPDLDRPIIDPFNCDKTLNIFCVILDAEKALWNFLVLKVPQLKDNFNEGSINKIRVNLVEQDPSLKFDLTRFRKEVVKELLLSLGLDTNEAIYYSNESFNEFFKARNKVQLYKDAKLILERLHRKTLIG